MKNFTTVVFAATTSIVIAVSAHADVGDQLFKLLPNQNVHGDEYAHDVAISGTTAIVGSKYDDDKGSNAGAAYFFDTITGQQVRKLFADDSNSHEHFGEPVAISGNIAIIGSRFHDDNNNLTGYAYLFNVISGQQIAKILPSEGAVSDAWGGSVAIGGSPGNETILIGATWDDDNGNVAGAAYLYNISDPAKPALIAKLLASDGAEGDNFGGSVAISGTKAVIGARNNDDNGINSGSAYLFDTITGQQIIKLLPNDGESGQRFGRSVAISGSIAIAGTSNHSSIGSAYLFDTTTGQQVAKLLADDGAYGDLFGTTVSISGTRVIVGANHDHDNGSDSGSAYIFDISDPVNPIQAAKLLPDDGGVDEYFGSSVGISGPPGAEVAIAGNRPFIYEQDVTGSAYLFDAAGFPPYCPWDLDKSGSVGTSDLLALFTQWGTDGPADFDGSGTVGTSDLLILFANWGPCG